MFFRDVNSIADAIIIRIRAADTASSSSAFDIRKKTEIGWFMYIIFLFYIKSGGKQGGKPLFLMRYENSSIIK